MSRLFNASLVVASVAGLLVLGTRAEGQPPQQIPGWGTVQDQDQDSRIAGTSDGLTITVPAGRHDLWFGGTDERTRFNAPQVLQEWQGDFVAVVQVASDLNNLTQAGTYQAAGLLVWDSEYEYLRFERNRSKTPGKPARPRRLHRQPGGVRNPASSWPGESAGHGIGATTPRRLPADRSGGLESSM